MNLFFSPILYLEIENDFSTFSIFQGLSIVNDIPADAWKVFGTSTAGVVVSHPIWFEYHEIGNRNRQNYTNEISGSKNFFLSIGLWLIKDNSIFSPNAYLYYTPEIFCTDNRNTFVSNSKGHYRPTKFSLEEFKLAENRVEKLKLIIDAKPHSPSTDDQPESVIISSFNMLEHNNFNRVHRAINFLTFARYNSHILIKISWYIVALEALFLTTNDGDISFKLRTRIPVFLGGSNEEKDKLYESIRSAYSMRSSFLHGDKISNKLKSLEKQIEISNEIDIIIRTIFNRIIDNEDDKNLFLNDKLLEDFFLNITLQKS
ncbi:HEPN domain-containing protein [Sphingobacterium faecium]|uniref:HEPN domain-containing protein n=1 Tax=Sphingobacterium faecium TaxID=34087 RepID=UPI0021B5D25A|nr:HEPN domain-containing protein [Sphingobacterium faecium]UXD67734.1 HEPN domain-containing protein [Sphingobacterium faecium]